jgi:chromate transporter
VIAKQAACQPAYPTSSRTAPGTDLAYGAMRELAKIFIAVGTQSVGGGASTLFLLRRFLVERRQLISEREFNEAWALCQLSPGIHLVALASLLGQRIAGWRGVIVAVSGMMVPAAIITVAMTAAYGLIADHPLAHAALAGMAPATGGMTIGLAIVLVRGARRHGVRAVVDYALVITAFAVLLLTTVSSVLVIVAAATFGALFLGRERPTSREATE